MTLFGRLWRWIVETLEDLTADRCGGHVAVYRPDEDPADIIAGLNAHPAVLGLAGNQRIQADLPDVTQRLWRWVATKFPGVAGLGAWGDRSHQARRSDHNRTTSSGKRGPRAVDIMTAKEAEHAAIVKALLLNRRELGLTLIISRRVKWSVGTGWAPRPYKGTSGHYDHVHVSCDA